MQTTTSLNHASTYTLDLGQLATLIKTWGRELGFDQVGITDIDLSSDEANLLRWLKQQFHGDMHYMARHGIKRSHPERLFPGTIRIVTVRMNYLPPDIPAGESHIQDPSVAFVARYAMGRDYHKLLRRRLQILADRIKQAAGPFGYRAFVDSAPVLEKALARNAGLGWIGKNTLLLNRQAGSYFFLGELFTDLPLPTDQPTSEHCGTCRACLQICPTQAITGPYQLDARRCISYLTIELHGSIPVEFRPLIGNRVFGCDDCQTVCPWNKYAVTTHEQDFHPRHGLDHDHLIELFLWTEAVFLARTEGSAIRRLGYERWLRNVAVALGNGPTTPAAIAALTSRQQHPSELVREHIAWALAQLGLRTDTSFV